MDKIIEFVNAYFGVEFEDLTEFNTSLLQGELGEVYGDDQSKLIELLSFLSELADELDWYMV